MPDLDIKQYTVHPLLGRHMARDRRSLAYRRPYDGEPIRPIEWTPKVQVLNQQDLMVQGIRTSRLVNGVPDVDALGSCTANAATSILSVLLDTDACKHVGLDLDNAAAAEEWAIRLYAEATQHDEWLEYTWPSDDCGSSGLGVVKALRARGLIDQYAPATTAEELCRDLQTGPVLAGVPWFNAWFSPVGPGALLDEIPDWEQSGVAGGHEVAVLALEDVHQDRTGGLDYDRTILRVRNSWSTAWGDEGCFRMSLGLYQLLRDQIDLMQPRLDSRSQT